MDSSNSATVPRLSLEPPTPPKAANVTSRIEPPRLAILPQWCGSEGTSSAIDAHGGTKNFSPGICYANPSPFGVWREYLRRTWRVALGEVANLGWLPSMHDGEPLRGE